MYSDKDCCNLHISFYCGIFLKISFIYLFWLHWVFVAMSGLSLVAVSGGYAPAVIHRFLITVASLVVEHRLNACGARA